MAYLHWQTRSKKEFDIINRMEMLVAKETGLTTEDIKAISFIEFYELYSSCINQLKEMNK